MNCPLCGSPMEEGDVVKKIAYMFIDSEEIKRRKNVPTEADAFRTIGYLVGKWGADLVMDAAISDLGWLPYNKSKKYSSILSHFQRWVNKAGEDKKKEAQQRTVKRDNEYPVVTWNGDA